MMGILYVSSFLKDKGHNVQLCDLSGIPEEYWYIPVGDIYGITGTSPNFEGMKKIIDLLKERNPASLVIVGGTHATVLPEHVLENTKADFCVVGEGEYTMMEIMSGHPLNKINGVVTREYSTPCRELEKNVNVFPIPDRESLDYYSYLAPHTYKYLSKEKEISIITGRGCPYKCSFCASYKIHKGKVRYRSAEKVYEEIKYLKDYYGAGLFNFIDDTFILNKKRVSKICDLIKSLKIKWIFLTRVDHVDYDLFIKMKDSGCISVTFGFESGSNRILKMINKGITVEMSYNAIKVSKKAGFKIRGQMMVGLPTETDEDVEETAKFIRTAKEVDTFGLHFFQPFPGCDIWENPNHYDYEFKKDTDFSTYHTIGRPGQKIDNEIINKRYEYLQEVVGEREIKHQGILE